MPQLLPLLFLLRRLLLRLPQSDGLLQGALLEQGEERRALCGSLQEGEDASAIPVGNK